MAVAEEPTVQQNIDYFARCTCGTRAAAPRSSTRPYFVGLEEYVKHRPRKLSGGLLRRLNIVRHRA
ncbi:MAG: hypothetical protein ACLSVD_15010 [Eggerthellaceae bacterium]